MTWWAQGRWGAGRNHKHLAYNIACSFSITYLKKAPLASASYSVHILHRHRKVKSQPQIIRSGEMQIRLRLSDPPNQLCNCTQAPSPRWGMLRESRADSEAGFQGQEEPQRCQGA